MSYVHVMIVVEAQERPGGRVRPSFMVLPKPWAAVPRVGDRVRLERYGDGNEDIEGEVSAVEWSTSISATVRVK